MTSQQHTELSLKVKRLDTITYEIKKYRDEIERIKEASGTYLINGNYFQVMDPEDIRQKHKETLTSIDDLQLEVKQFVTIKLQGKINKLQEEYDSIS